MGGGVFSTSVVHFRALATILSAGEEAEQGTGRFQAGQGLVMDSAASASDRCISLPKEGEEQK